MGMGRQLTVNPTKSSTYLLGIETSGGTCAAGLARNGQVIAEISANIKNIHSKMLAPFVDSLLKTAGLSAQDLSGVVVSAGPGSFTGLRIGYSVAKGLAHALNVPIIEVPTLDIWVYQAGWQPAPVLSVIDAHRSEIFCAVYQWKDHLPVRKTDYLLLTPEELSKIIEPETLIVGAASGKLNDLLTPCISKNSRFHQPAPSAPRVWALLALGTQKFNAAEFSNVPDCEPFYMRAFKGVT